VSVVQAVFLGLSNHLVESRTGDGILPVAIFEHVDESHSPMGSYFSKRHYTRLEKLDHKRTADVQELCRLCRGDFGSQRGDAYAVASLQLLHYQQESVNKVTRNFDSVTIEAREASGLAALLDERAFENRKVSVID